MKVKQFEVWQADLNSTKGSEQSGIRPVLILETNAANGKGLTTVVVPFTTKLRTNPFSRTTFTPNLENGLSATSQLKIRHIRVLDIRGLKQRLGYIENKKQQSQVLDQLALLFDFEGLFRESRVTAD